MKKTVLELGEDIDLAQFLSRRGPRAHLVMPQQVLAALRQCAPQAAWTGSTTLADIPASAQRLFVYDPDDEAGLIARARSARPALEILGVLQHVIPVMAAHRHPLGASQPAMAREAESSPAHRFAVVCTPRTGSTFLCELLHSGGLGAPKEHLRMPLVHVLRSAGVDHEEVYAQVMRHGSVHGIFGTKIISHFLFDAFGQAQAADRLQCLCERGFRFIRLRRDEMAQAVSKHVSQHSGVWHEVGSVSAQAQQRMAGVAYDFEGIRQHYVSICAEGRALDVAMSQLAPGAVLELHYEQLVAQPLQALAQCARFLGLPADAGAIRFELLPTKLSAGVDHSQLLRQRFEAELAQH